MYYMGAVFANCCDEAEDIFIAIFALMLGAFAAGQAQQFGPDIGKSKKAANTVFKIIDYPTKIDAVNISPQAVPAPPKD